MLNFILQIEIDIEPSDKVGIACINVAGGIVSAKVKFSGRARMIGIRYEKIPLTGKLLFCLIVSAPVHGKEFEI